MNRSTKHSKFRNTGLIFEFLLRQITSDVLSKTDECIALNIVKKRFNENTELGKELSLYNVLINQKFKSDRKADYFITEVLKNRAQLNNSVLRREKYNLIKQIKENYNVNIFFASKVPQYKLNASIYKLFEYQDKLSPESKTESYFNILEHITTNKKGNISLYDTINEKKLPSDEDLRLLTYKTLLEKFNKKYSTLDGNQRALLRAFINNISNNNSLKEYVDKRIPYLVKELKKNKDNIKNKVVQIKLKEAINSINKFCGSGKNKNIKDSSVVQMMRYYELLKELKSAGKK